MSRAQPNLAGAHAWFDKEIIPKRTTSAGFSINRVWHGPRGLATRNVENPNGLCGDAAAYVHEKFFADFGDYATNDGHQISMILWDGIVFNHIADVMVPEKKATLQRYELKGHALVQTLGKSETGPTTLTAEELFALPVYDLYYKKRTTIGAWWEELDSGKDGNVTIAKYHQMNDL